MEPADHVGRQAERCVVSKQPPMDDAETIATPPRNRIDRYWCGLPERAFTRPRASVETIDLTSMLCFTVAHPDGNLRFAYL